MKIISSHIKYFMLQHEKYFFATQKSIFVNGIPTCFCQVTFCADHVQLSREAPHEKIRTLRTLFFSIVSISSRRSVYVVCALFSWPGKKNKLLLIGTNSTLRPRPFRTLKRGVPASSIEKNDPFLKKPFPQSKGFRSGRL